MNTPINPIQNNVVAISNGTHIFIPHPNYMIGISQFDHSNDFINLQSWFQKATHSPRHIKMLFEENDLTSTWWEYIKEHRNQFLSKTFIENNLIILKNFYNNLMYENQFGNANINSENPEIISFFNEYDFCNQVLAAGKYIPNPPVNEAISLLSEKQIADLMQNHIVVLEDKLQRSPLQNIAQHDVLNNILTHTILSYWEWQSWISV
jgi:hypothetical protein